MATRPHRVPSSAAHRKQLMENWDTRNEPKVSQVRDNLELKKKEESSKDPAHFQRIEDIEFEPAEPGTFPTFEENGDFPYEDIFFNALTRDLSEDLGTEYEVQVGKEIPLEGFSGKKYKKLSPKVLPSHIFELPSVFIPVEAEGENEVPELYVLPPGYYCLKGTMGNENYTQHCQTSDTEVHVDEGEPWLVTFIMPGFFFHDMKVFNLPKGLMISLPEGVPKPLHYMVHFKTMSEYQHNIFPDFQPLECMRKVYKEKTSRRFEIFFERWLNREELMLCFIYHAARLNLDEYTLLRVFMLYFEPALRERIPCEPEFKCVLQDSMELFFSFIQVTFGGCYYGPAPPYYILKRNMKARKSAKRQARDTMARQIKTKHSPHKNANKQFQRNIQTSFQKRTFVPNPQFGSTQPIYPSRLVDGDVYSGEPDRYSSEALRYGRSKSTGYYDHTYSPEKSSKRVYGNDYDKKSPLSYWTHDVFDALNTSWPEGTDTAGTGKPPVMNLKGARPKGEGAPASAIPASNNASLLGAKSSKNFPKFNLNVAPVEDLETLRSAPAGPKSRLPGMKPVKSTPQYYVGGFDKAKAASKQPSTMMRGPPSGMRPGGYDSDEDSEYEDIDDDDNYDANRQKTGEAPDFMSLFGNSENQPPVEEPKKLHRRSHEDFE